jgi:hypothetical protein
MKTEEEIRKAYKTIEKYTMRSSHFRNALDPDSQQNFIGMMATLEWVLGIDDPKHPNPIDTELTAIRKVLAAGSN